MNQAVLKNILVHTIGNASNLAEYVQLDGYSIVSQVHSTPEEVWSSIGRESHGAWVNPVEPEALVTGESDKENITPDHMVTMQSSIDREIFGQSDAELSTSDHPDIAMLSREDSPTSAKPGAAAQSGQMTIDTHRAIVLIGRCKAGQTTATT